MPRGSKTVGGILMRCYPYSRKSWIVSLKNRDAILENQILDIYKGFFGQKNIRRVPTFPGRCQPGILGTGELNFCVRDGNRCGLSVSLTGMVGSAGFAPSKLHRRGCA